MGIIKFNNVPSTTPGLEVETFPNYVAPEKEYQVTHVPGRNGDLVVDTKTYKNVPRSYKVSMAVEPPAVSVSGSTASFEATAERALAECKTAISSDVGKVGTTIINSVTDPVENNEPYNFRAVPNGVGDRENDTLIGGTVAWNQLARDMTEVSGSYAPNKWYVSSGTATVSSGVVTLTPTAQYGRINCLVTYTANHKLLVMGDLKLSNSSDADNVTLSVYAVDTSASGLAKCSTTTEWQHLQAIYTYTSANPATNRVIVTDRRTSNWGTIQVKNIICIDLTQMFGSTIADYIYGLETATAGAGVAWFRNLFPKDYYAYNAGELISVKTEAHKMVGFNQFDKSTAQSNKNIDANGNLVNGSFVVSDFIPVIPSTMYYFKNIESSYYARPICEYDKNKKFIGDTTVSASSSTHSVSGRATLMNNCYYIRIIISPSSIDTCCINLSDTSKNGTYEPYEEHIYPLNPALELRGMLKLNSSNKLYYDGDIYSSDGSVIRKYGIVDLGSLSWSYATSAAGTKVFISLPPINIKRPIDTDIIPNIVNSNGYEVKSWYALNAGASASNGITIFATDGSVRIVDSNYSDATAFKTDMSGVYLIYELATPVIESTSGLIDNVSIASFDDGADNEPVNSLVVDITAIESGSGEKSPDNPYTISGFDNGVVKVTNHSTVIEKPLQVFVDASGIVTQSLPSLPYNCVIARVIQGETYTYSVNGVATTIPVLAFFDKYPLLGTQSYNSSRITNENATFTAPITGFVFIRGNLSFDEINQMVAIGTNTEYEQGNTYTFAFGQTVYGGHFDNKGNLVVTHKILSFDYQSNWRFENILGGNFYIACGSDVKASQFGDDLSCNCSPTSSILALTTNTCLISVAKNFNFTWGGTLGITNVDDFKTYLQTNNLVIKVKCLLATPITLAITSQDIPTLLGENNIFANTGNIKSLSYPKQVCPFEPAQEVDDHGTEEYVDNREVAMPVGHESKYFTAGKIYNFSWLDEAGLIKEGELNAYTGVLIINDGYGIVDLGSLSWTYTSGIFYTDGITDKKVLASGSGLENLLNIYYTVVPSSTSVSNMPNMSIKGQVGAIRIYIKNSNYTEAATFKSAMHGVKLLYELADPVRTIQLTPVQVESLIGHNVLISESGNISVTPRTYSTYTEKMNAISDWLHSASGYARLEDTYEPDYYRKAYYDEQTDMENIFNEAGQATLNFICKPQRYLKSGEEPIAISSGGLIQNRTRYEAYPILKVTTNNTQGSVSIGNHSITIKAGAGTDPITIDCELQDAWSGTSNKNSYIVLTDGEFPVIDPGAQTVIFDGGVQSVEVIPRWWTV